MSKALCGRLYAGSVGLAALALAGCGGGGGGGGPQPTPAPPAVAPTPTPTPAPAPTPTPTPTPPPVTTPTGFVPDAEYQQSKPAEAANAAQAYTAGATGAGVKIAIIDSGINASSPEFAGRIDPASRDIVADRGVSDSEGHGTAVSSVAAGGRNGILTQGVAYQATILSLRTDETGPCDKDDGCSHSDNDLAVAVDVARENGAKVINMSLGGGSPNSNLLGAIGRASSAGIVVVIAAGNEGTKPEGVNPDSFGLDSAKFAGNGLVMIVGAHDQDRELASFSNRAGTGAQYYIAAMGVGVPAPDEKNSLFLWSGTSFSTPAVSGAAALLAQAFPNLTGAQIVQLLFETADDAGAPGMDAVYGRGILNIGRAFQPKGQTSLAGSAVPVSLTDNGQASPAMGDAKGPTMAGVIILDGYSRAYAVDLARTLSSAPQQRPLGLALQGDVSTATAAAGHTAVSVTMRRNLSNQPQVGLAQMGLTYEDGRKAKALAALAVTRMGPKTAVALGFSESGRTLQQRLADRGEGAFLVARDPLARNGFTAGNGSAVGVRHELGSLALTVTGEQGEVRSEGLPRSFGRSDYSIGAVTAERRFGRASVSLAASRLSEERTVLGGRFSDALAAGGATTLFLDGGLSYDFGRGWSSQASYRRGWTSMQGSGALVRDGALSTDAWSIDVSKRSALFGGDRLAFRVMQPLRVRSGGFDLAVPVSYDYATGGVGYQGRAFSLSPKGREIDFEAAYGVPALGGHLGANLFLRTDPGHFEAMRDDLGAAIRFSLGF